MLAFLEPGDDLAEDTVVRLLLLGPADPSSRIHGEDESLHLDDWRKLMESEVRLLAEIAESSPG